MYTSIDPTTGEPLADWPLHDSATVDRLLSDASDGWQIWRRTGFSTRALALNTLAQRLEDREEALARRMASEMGKPLGEGRGEVRKCAWVCRYYAEHAASFLADEDAPTDAGDSRIAHAPLGVVLAIMPWNFPLWQALRFGAPALMAGNGVVFKHAPTVQGCAEDLVALFSGLVPRGLVANLRVDNEGAAQVIADPRIAAVTFTGSTAAGARVASVAGAHLKKTVLELGGSDPFVVLADADIEAAAEAAAASRLLNAGQSCIAAKRCIVEESVATAFTAALRRRLEAAVVGDPTQVGTTVGPMARDDLRQQLHEQIVRSVDAGATLALGGTLPDGPGWFYPVTLLTDVGPGQPAWEEELFGPAAALHVVPDEASAIAAANDTPFGLAASVWTERADPAPLVARIDAGAVFVNGMSKSDPRIPFGGIKRSGWGRELGRDGILEFVNRKTVWVR